MPKTNIFNPNIAIYFDFLGKNIIGGGALVSASSSSVGPTFHSSSVTLMLANIFCTIASGLMDDCDDEFWVSVLGMVAWSTNVDGSGVVGCSELLGSRFGVWVVSMVERRRRIWGLFET